MSATDRARALQRQVNVVPEVAPSAPAPPAEGGKVKLVRQTVDIPHARHVALAQWRMETAVALGRTRLTNQEALSALVSVLLTDETVARRVRAKIADRD